MHPHFGYETVLMGMAFPPTDAEAGTITGETIDRRGYEGDCSFLVTHGVVSGNPSAFTINAHVEETDDATNGPWTDVDLAADVADGADAITAMNDDSTTHGVESLRIKLENRMAYLRMVCVVTLTSGSSPAVPVAGFYMLAGARQYPITQP